MDGKHTKPVESRTEEERSAPFKLEVAKRRRSYEHALSKLKEAQQALDDAEREYGETHRALQALGYDD